MRRWSRYWFWTFVYFAKLHLRYLFQARAIDREVAITNYILQGYRKIAMRRALKGLKQEA